MASKTFRDSSFVSLDVDKTDLLEIRRMLRALTTEVPDDFQAAGVEAADVIEREMLMRVPRLSGQLARTIRSGGTRRSPWVAAGAASAPYAFPIEFGFPRRNIEPQSFVYSSIAATSEQALKAYENALDRHFNVF